ncbi:transcriptional Coactivator p15-domain-containing protein [Peziza echinospora]|nr:transcriptional Coactivator p15-domain-containing protein [Peziza echinospora]
MPPQKRAIAKASRDDFVVDDDSEVESKQKRTKTAANASTTKAAASKSKEVATSDKRRNVDVEGNPYWEIGGKLRRVTVSKFKRNYLVNIREHYEKNGVVLPGKKGISLSVEQFNAFMEALPQVLEELGEVSDETIVIPNFSKPAKGVTSASKPKSPEESEEDEEDEEEEEEEEDD